VIAELPTVLLAHLQALGAETRSETRRRFEQGEPIPEGHRNIGLFWHAVRLLRDGLAPQEALARLLELNRQLCQPPLDEKRARMQFTGATRFVREHPSGADNARVKARQALRRELPADNRESAHTTKAKRVVRLRPLRAVNAEPVEYAIDNKVPYGTGTLLAGIGGLGKSAMLLCWAKEITDKGGNVLIVSYEDAAAQVLRPRYEALGGNIDRLFELYVDPADGSVSFPTDLGELDRHVRETGARAVLIDPVSASIDLRLDAHKDQDVRVVLGQLAHLAERERLAIVMNAHVNKATSADPYLRINGSTAFYNAARSVLTVTRDPEEPDEHRLLAHHKNNYGRLAAVERWRVVPKLVTTEAGPMEVMTMEFVDVADDVSRDDVLAPHRTPDKLDNAITFLKEALSDGDWHDSAGVVAMAGAHRISERTLRRAALEQLEVEHERRGFPSSTWWRNATAMPTPSAEPWHDWEGRMNKAIAPAVLVSRANDSGERHDHPHPRLWQARDGVWRTYEFDPPAFPGEVVDERGSW
jgi:AAA domain/Primase C terminal 1 (PriCT-1)